MRRLGKQVDAWVVFTQAGAIDWILFTQVSRIEKMGVQKMELEPD